MSTRHAIIETTRGTLTAELFDRDCPETVETFTRLAGEGFYDGAPLAPTVPGAVVEAAVRAPAGDAAATRVPVEVVGNRNRAEPGALLLGRVGEHGDAARVLFVTDARGARLLEGHNTVFGLTEEGMDVLRALGPGDVVRTVRVRE